MPGVGRCGGYAAGADGHWETDGAAIAAFAEQNPWLQARLRWAAAHSCP